MTTTHNEISQKSMTGQKAQTLLREGNLRFLKHEFLHRDFEAQRKATEEGQFPFAVILICIDSRTPTKIIFDQGIGDIFNVRMAGNVVSENVLGSLEFACKLAGAKLILILGHTFCGAVKGACDHLKMGNLTGLLQKIEPAMIAVNTAPGDLRSSANLDFVDMVARKNIGLTMESIRRESLILNEMLEKKDIKLAGAMYDISTGKVEFDLFPTI